MLTRACMQAWFTAYIPSIWYWTFMLRSIDSCQKVSAEQYHVILSYFKVNCWPSTGFWLNCRLMSVNIIQEGIKMFFTAFVLCSLRFLKLKTGSWMISTEQWRKIAYLESITGQWLELELPQIATINKLNINRKRHPKVAKRKTKLPYILDKLNWALNSPAQELHF